MKLINQKKYLDYLERANKTILDSKVRQEHVRKSTEDTIEQINRLKSRVRVSEITRVESRIDKTNSNN